MKKLAFYPMLGLAALLALGACKKDDATSTPVITLSTSTLSVSAEGGEYSVAYQVENAVDGTSVTVDFGSVAWISDVSVTSSTIDFYVAANTYSATRSATVTVSCSGAESQQFTVTQEAYIAEYDYNHNLSVFDGYYYPSYGNGGEDMFYIWLSDLGFDASGSSQVGGHYYNFIFLVNSSDGTIPEGTYVYTSASYAGNMVFSSASRYVYQYSGGYDLYYFTAGSITVSVSGSTYTFEGTVTDENGDVHYIYYTGSAVCEDTTMDVGTLEDPIDMTATAAVAAYYAHNSEVMCVTMQFTDMQVSSGSVVPPGALLSAEVYLPYDADGYITPGTYTVQESISPYSIWPGYVDSGYVYGSYIVDYETQYSYDIGLISSGTMTIVETSTGVYTITCEFATEEGVSVKSSYSGSLVVQGMPEPFSTLTEDITVDLSGKSGTAYYYGNIYGTGSYWSVILGSTTAGEVVLIDLVTDASGGYSAGITSATYTAAQSTYPAVGEYAQGYMSGDALYPTLYAYISGGYATEYAPATSGDIVVVNNGDGSYDISFACVDDKGWTWSGSWSGTLSMSDYSSYYSSVSSLSESPVGSVRVKGADNMSEMERKAAARDANLLKVTSSPDFISKYLQ